jgi:hypothetical protein
VESPIFRIFHFSPAIAAENGIGWHQGALSPAEGRSSDFKLFLTNRFEGFLLDPIKPCQRWEFGRQAFEEGFDGLGWPLDLHRRSLGVVDHPADETEVARDAVDRRAETNALNGAAAPDLEPNLWLATHA